MTSRLSLSLLLLSATLSAQTIASKTAGMKHLDGFLPLNWDAKAGKLYLEIPHLDTDILYSHSLPYGTGSNDLSLDRGQISEGQIVRFERTGPKVLLVQPNQAFRSTSTDPAEQLSVRQSFPEGRSRGPQRRGPRRRHRLLPPRRPRRSRTPHRTQARHL